MESRDKNDVTRLSPPGPAPGTPSSRQTLQYTGFLAKETYVMCVELGCERHIINEFLNHLHPVWNDDESWLSRNVQVAKVKLTLKKVLTTEQSS